MRRHSPALAVALLSALAAACSSASERDGAGSDPLVAGSISCGAFCRFTPRTRGDTDGDLKSDLVLVGTGSASTIPTAISAGDGHFAYVDAPIIGDTKFGTYATQGRARSVLGDFNADGLADIALLGGSAGTTPWTTIPVAYGMPRHAFSAVNSSGGGNKYLTQLAGQESAQVVASDVNADGFDDLVIVSSGSLVFGLGAGGGGNFTTYIPHAAAAGDYDPGVFGVWSTQAGAKLLAGDFDGDGLGDAALIGGVGRTSIPVAFSRSGYGVHTTNIATAEFAGWASSPGVTAVSGDFNGDKKTDIALVGGSGWNTIPIAFSNGNGSFTVSNKPFTQINAWASANVWDWSPGPHETLVRGAWLVAGDYNGDGKSDLALAGGGPNWNGMIPVAFSNGDGTFGKNNAATSYTATGASAALASVTTTAVLGASSLPSPTDECGSILNVSAHRVLASDVEVEFDLLNWTRVRIGASRVAGAPYPDPVTDVFLSPGPRRKVTLHNLTDGAEYFVQVAPSPLPWSNDVATCGSTPIDIPANPCGGEGQACCASGNACASDQNICVPADPAHGYDDAHCSTCGGAGWPCCQGPNGPWCNDPGTGTGRNVCGPGAAGPTTCNYVPIDNGGGSNSGGSAPLCAHLTCYENCGYSCSVMTGPAANGTYCAETDAYFAKAPGCTICCDSSCMQSVCGSPQNWRVRTIAL